MRRNAFTARVRPTEAAATRLAVIASRGVGNAVVRNRARRRVREAFRHAAAGAPPADVVVSVRPDASATDFGTLRRDAETALRDGAR